MTYVNQQPRSPREYNSNYKLDIAIDAATTDAAATDAAATDAATTDAASNTAKPVANAGATAAATDVA